MLTVYMYVTTNPSICEVIVVLGILVNIGSDDGLLPVQHQAITWSNDALLLNQPIQKDFSEILIKTQNFTVKKMHLKVPAK